MKICPKSDTIKCSDKCSTCRRFEGKHERVIIDHGAGCYRIRQEDRRSLKGDGG